MSPPPGIGGRSPVVLSQQEILPRAVSSAQLQGMKNEQTALPGQPEEKGVVGEREITTRTSRQLLDIRAHKPLRLFQDELTIDELKVNFIYRFFFGSEQVRSFLIKDIQSVIVESSAFFSTLKIAVGDFKEITPPRPAGAEPPLIRPGPMAISFLRRGDAEQARRLIQGLIIMDQQKIDTTKMEVPALVAKAEELGRAR